MLFFFLLWDPKVLSNLVQENISNGVLGLLFLTTIHDLGQRIVQSIGFVSDSGG